MKEMDIFPPSFLKVLQFCPNGGCQENFTEIDSKKTTENWGGAVLLQCKTALAKAKVFKKLSVTKSFIYLWIKGQTALKNIFVNTHYVYIGP